MNSEILAHVEEQLSEFEKLSGVLGDKEKFKNIGTEVLQKFFRNLFLKGPSAEELRGNDFIVGVIHFWSYQYQERLTRLYFPEWVVQTPYQKAVSSYGKEKRRTFGEMVYRDSERKVPVTFRIGDYQLMKGASEENTIVIPRDILLGNIKIPVGLNKNIEGNLKQLSEKTAKEIINDTQVDEFMAYFSKKMKSLVKTTISAHDKISIILRAQLIVLRGWEYGYCFPSSILQSKPTGGFDLWYKKPLAEEKINILQTISNLINGKLCAIDMLT